MEPKSCSITHLTWNTVSKKASVNLFLIVLPAQEANSVITDIKAKIKEFKIKQISRGKRKQLNIRYKSIC